MFEKRQFPHFLLPILVIGLAAGLLNAQTYTSYFTGDTTDFVSSPSGGICLMGGATEDDNAMRWFLQRCNGGDVLVLRASGSNGYNAYLYSQLGVTVNSVETIVCNSQLASNEPYVQSRIQKAEAIWFAGGDQWDYVTYWRGTKIDSLINVAIRQRHIVIGGTSAGMAIQGGVYFSAQNGTVTSATAMGNPYAPAVAVDSLPFIENDILHDVITDTHYDNPDRRGRQVTFLARCLTDWGREVKGIACDEYTAVCIDTNGIAAVYGDFPNNDDNAYFIQVNCSIPNNVPEVCLPNLPLQWDQNGVALKVYSAKGTPTGANTFDLNDWKSGNGGTWEDWSVYNATLFTAASTEITCGPVAIASDAGTSSVIISPNPTTDGRLQVESTRESIRSIRIVDALGQVRGVVHPQDRQNAAIDISSLAVGSYWIVVETESSRFVRTVLRR